MARLLLWLLTLLSWGAAARAAEYTPPVPTRSIKEISLEWHDAKRSRVVPVKLYLPAKGQAPAPVIIFSHGLGGSREGYAYLGRYWAGCGYAAVHLQHLGSDEAVWRGVSPSERMQALRRATINLQAIATRPQDVSFALDQLTMLEKDPASELRERLDLRHVGVAGHSFGAFTVMACVGQQFGAATWRDPRITAGLAMSAPVPRPRQRVHAYGAIRVPVFHMTGTKDDSPISETAAEERRIPYDGTSGAEACLLTLEGGDHMVFSGSARARESVQGLPLGGAGAREHGPEFQALICTASTAWWDAQLRGDRRAQQWLMHGGFADVLGHRGTFEAKHVQ